MLSVGREDNRRAQGLDVPMRVSTRFGVEIDARVSAGTPSESGTATVSPSFQQIETPRH
jgi:hypothetical protein